MTTQELKQYVDKVLGDSIKCLLPSYWWKKCFHAVADSIDKVIPIVQSKKDLEKLNANKGTIAKLVVEDGEKSFRECYQIDENFDGDIESLFASNKLTQVSNIICKGGIVTSPILGILCLANRSITSAIYLSFGLKDDVSVSYLWYSREGMGSGSELLLSENGVINHSAVDFLNKTLHSDSFYYIDGEVILHRDDTDEPLSFEESFYYADKFFLWGDNRVDAYIKGETWERLAKESDTPNIVIDEEMSNTSTNAVQNKVITTAINNKVEKVSGKQLSTEDFTTVLKTKLEGLSNFDSTEIVNKINGLQSQLDTLVSSDASSAIESFNEIIAFLNGIKDSENLDNIIASIEQQIASKQDKLVSGTSIKTINGESILGSGDIKVVVDTSNLATKSEVNAKQDKITDLSEIRSGAALGKTALQSYTEKYTGTVTGIKMNGTTKSPSSGTVDIGNVTTGVKINGTTKAPSSGIVDLGTVITTHQDISHLATKTEVNTKQDKIDDIATIRSGAAKGATALQTHQDISHLATKAEVQTIIDEVVETEEIYAAAVNDLNTRIVNTENSVSSEISNRESLQEEFQAFKTQVTENEEIWATSLTDINTRIDNNYQYGEDTYATKESLNTEIQTINTTILDNEEVIAATLTDLNNQIASLNALITDLTNRIETLENA